MLKYITVLVTSLVIIALSGCASTSVYQPANYKTNHKHLPKINIYGTASCFNTIMAKAYMREHGIPYHYYSVVNSPKGREFYIKAKAPGIPIITVGKQQILGYETSLIDNALKKAGYNI